MTDPTTPAALDAALDALEAERDDLRARLAVALEGCCPDCGGSGHGVDFFEGLEHHTPPCPLCEGSGLTPDARRMTAQRDAARAERDAALARVAELEAPGECQSLHKLRAEVERLKVELAKPVAGPWEDEGPGLVRGGHHGKLAASLWPNRWNVYSPETGDPVASGSEAGEEGRRLADAAAVAAGWRLCDRA